MENFINEANIYFILKIIMIFGALQFCLLGLLNIFGYSKKFNLIELISFKNEIIEKGIYIIILLATIYIMLQRKTYLPFLDVAVVPLVKLLPESKQKNFELEIIINAGKGQKVIYWASNKTDVNENGGKNRKEEISDWQKAYGDYENSGVSAIEIDGTAKLYIKCPRKYYVMYGKIIPKHVHYRVVKDGLIGEVKTINIEC
jgi:uncharacterized membrane protein YuzA (DUF378 family)